MPASDRSSVPYTHSAGTSTVEASAIVASLVHEMSLNSAVADIAGETVEAENELLGMVLVEVVQLYALALASGLPGVDQRRPTIIGLGCQIMRRQSRIDSTSALLRRLGLETGA